MWDDTAQKWTVELDNGEVLSSLSFRKNVSYHFMLVVVFGEFFSSVVLIYFVFLLNVNHSCTTC